MPRPDLHDYLEKEETILWEARPNKKSFVFESIFNPMFFISLIWSGIDVTLLTLGIIDSNGQGNEFWGFIIYAVFHMLPVWLYIISLIVMLSRYHNRQYIITNKSLYISRGVFKYHYEKQPLSSIGKVEIHQGIFDKLFKVGDLVLEISSSEKRYQIINIPDYQEVSDLLTKQK